MTNVTSMTEVTGVTWMTGGMAWRKRRYSSPPGVNVEKNYRQTGIQTGIQKVVQGVLADLKYEK